MKTDFIRTAIVGGGHCGVNMACWLQASSEPYLILERKDTLLWQWKKARWDGVQLNTPHRFSKFYGQTKEDGLPSEVPCHLFEKQRSLWDKHIAEKKLNYQLGFAVKSIEKQDEGSQGRFLIRGALQGEEEDCCLAADNVVVCTECTIFRVCRKSLRDYR